MRAGGRPTIPYAELHGKKFNKLTVIADLGLKQGKRQRARYVRCLCDCGNEVDCRLDNLQNGRPRSCGCAIQEGAQRRTTHSMTDSRVYGIWVGMRQRVTNPNAAGYRNYGGRGITVDPAWNSFEQFIEDMGPPPSDAHTLDRRNPNGNYCKDNCRWVTMSVQVRNRRNSVILEHAGRRLNLVDWARELGIHPMTLRGRIDKGWPLEVALTTRKIETRRTL
jgi:hypothetical protein